MFGKINEYNYALHPDKPGVMILDLTKRSKRRLRIRNWMPLLVTAGGFWLVAKVVGEIDRQQTENLKNQHIPTED